MPTLQELIMCEIGDFFASFGQPGEPETPEEMQQQLSARVVSLMTNSHQTEPVYQYREIDSGLWDECGEVWYRHCCVSPEHETRILYTCPSLFSASVEIKGALCTSCQK
jgi:hypothetical protein